MLSRLARQLGTSYCRASLTTWTALSQQLETFSTSSNIVQGQDTPKEGAIPDHLRDEYEDMVRPPAADSDETRAAMGIMGEQDPAGGGETGDQGSKGGHAPHNDNEKKRLRTSSGPVEAAAASPIEEDPYSGGSPQTVSGSKSKEEAQGEDSNPGSNGVHSYNKGD